MAIIEGNPFVQGARGMVMNQIVYRQRDGKTILSAKPKKSDKPLTDKQKAQHSRLNEGNKYAERVKADEVLFEIYQAEATASLSWHNRAVKDYLEAPVIEDVLVKGFTGKAGDTIVIYAFDNFSIASVKVTITDSEGNILEAGEANVEIDNGKYVYRLKADIPTEKGVKLKAEARDLPGNVTVCEHVLVEGVNESDSEERLVYEEVGVSSRKAGGVKRKEPLAVGAFDDGGVLEPPPG